MLGRNGNIAYVRYDSHGRIVPGGPIISPSRPKVGNWQPLSLVTGNSVTSNSLRAFVRIDAYGRVVPSSLLLLSGAPSDADSGTYWLEINATYRPYVPSTTTTTTTSGGSTTTTTSSTTSTTSTTTTLVPGSTTTTTTTINCNFVANVNTTFPGGPVGVTAVQRCTSLHIPPWFEIINYTGGSGEYTLLTYNGVALLSYETATSLVNGTIIPTPIVNGWDLYHNSLPEWPAGTKFWIVFADFNNHDNRIVVPLVVGECPPQGPTNTIFMKFNTL